MEKDDLAPCLHCCDKWVIRCIIDGNRFFWYVDGPRDGVDDGSLNTVWNWENYADIEPIFFFGDYVGLPKAFENKLVFKQSCTKDSKCLAFFYHINIDMEPKPISECKYMISFQGSISSDFVRKKMFDSLNKFSSFSFQPNNKMWWGFEEKEKQKLRKSYLELINDSQFVMCPRGVGLNSIRFFETLRMGRIPVLISDNCKLPLEHKINFDKFVVRVPTKEVENTIEYVNEFYKTYNISEASLEARKISLECFENVDEFLKRI